MVQTTLGHHTQPTIGVLLTPPAVPVPVPPAAADEHTVRFALITLGVR